MELGVQAAFAEQNAAGGVRGQQLRLIALDDGYEPERTAPNMHRLAEDPQVLAIIGNVGTPTAVVAAPIAVKHKLPFFAAYTGAGVLRLEPPQRYVINYRASYAEETGAMVDALVEHLGVLPEEFAFFTQRDAYGDAGYAGAIDALARYGLASEQTVQHVRYERNTVVVEHAVADLLLADPQPRVVVMVGAYQPCAAFIREAKRAGIDALFCNVSFVGAQSLQRELKGDCDKVIVTQVVPHYRSRAPIATRYFAALAHYNGSASPSFGSFEGYVATRVLIEALEKFEGPVDREAIVDALEGLGVFDIGLGAPLCLTSADHQACHQVWPTILRRDEVAPVEWVNLEDENGR